MKFTKKEVELIKYALEYLNDAELSPENGWDNEDVAIIESLIKKEFEITDK